MPQPIPMYMARPTTGFSAMPVAAKITPVTAQAQTTRNMAVPSVPPRAIRHSGV